MTKKVYQIKGTVKKDRKNRKSNKPRVELLRIHPYIIVFKKKEKEKKNVLWKT